MSDNGFVTIVPLRSGRSRLTGMVSFTPTMARFPADTLEHWPARMDWQWDGKGTVRARFVDAGRIRVMPPRPGATQYTASAAGLQSQTGLDLSKQWFRITKVDGNDVYIDVSSAVKS